MKTLHYFYLVLGIVILGSCSKDDPKFEEYTLATPIIMSIDDIRASVNIESAKEISESGKMYVYQDYIFVNDHNEGIHVIDNSNPEAPVKLKFLKIPGNIDISVKGDVLYADSYMDLVYFDISDITTISFLGRIEDVLPVNFNWPTAHEYATQNVDYSTQVIIDWTLTTEVREIITSGSISIFSDASQSAGEVGTGGSLARFKIVDDYLYAVDSQNINIFNITNLSSPISIGTEGVGWQIETIFSDDDYLYIGSNSGMFIYNIVNPAAPQYVSEVSHILGCDPVVVQGDYAYVTIRGGNNCTQEISQLDVIDISNKSNPFIVTSIVMNEPYGLGIHDNTLYVSDGTSGLKLFDVTVPENISLSNSIPDLYVFDVIPMEDKLIVVGNDLLSQYNYEANGISLISILSL